MGIRLEDYLATLPAEERAAIAEGTARLVEQEATLRQVREACGLTQEALGEAMGVRPAAVSKVERRDDVSVRTLRRHVRAMGGELYLVAKMPGKAPVQLKGFGSASIADAGEVRRGRPSSKGGKSGPAGNSPGSSDGR